MSEEQTALIHMAQVFERETGHGVIFTSSLGGKSDPLQGGIWASTDDGFHWQRRFDLLEPLPTPNEIVTEFWEDYEMWNNQIDDSQDSD